MLCARCFLAAFPIHPCINELKWFSFSQPLSYLSSLITKFIIFLSNYSTHIPKLLIHTHTHNSSIFFRLQFSLLSFQLILGVAKPPIHPAYCIFEGASVSSTLIVLHPIRSTKTIDLPLAIGYSLIHIALFFTGDFLSPLCSVQLQSSYSRRVRQPMSCVFDTRF